MPIDQKLDKIIEKQSEMNITIAKMEVDLAHHIKRSDQHEEHLNKQDKKINYIWYVLIASASAAGAEYALPLIKYIGSLM